MDQNKINTELKLRLVFALQCLMLPMAFIGVLLFRQPEMILHALFFTSGTAVLGYLLFLWFRMHPRDDKTRGSRARLFYAGVIITTLPLVYYALAATFGLYKSAQIALFSSMLKVTSYEEQPITWEGFEHPVGIRVKLGLEYPFFPGGWIRHPRITVPGSTALSANEEGDRIAAYSDYWQQCQAAVVEGDGCFTQPIWPVKKYPELPDGGKAELVYEFYPSNLNYYGGINQLCLRERSPYTGVKTAQPVMVYWHLAYKNNIYDIAPILQAAMDEYSTFFKSQQSIESAYGVMQSNEFVIAGYHNCKIKTAIRFDEESECFCREVDAKEETGKDQKAVE